MVHATSAKSAAEWFEADRCCFAPLVLSVFGSVPAAFPFSGWAVTVPERTTPIQYTLKPLYSLLPTGPKRTALKIVISAYVNSAGKYPSVDNRAGTGYGSVSEEAPTPSPIFNNLMRTSPVTQRP